MIKKLLNKYSLVLILFVALVVRLYQVNWDKTYHMHPDERYITMVTLDVQWPESIGQYLDTLHSPLSPYNREGSKNYSYGTFPLWITKYTAEVVDMHNYDQIQVVGRFWSTVADIGTLIFLYQIAKKLFNRKTAYLASILYALSVISIQNSHFYTTDNLAVLGTTATFYILLGLAEFKAVDAKTLANNLRISILAGLIFGIVALGSKLSALIFTPLFLIVNIFVFIKAIKKKEPINGLMISVSSLSMIVVSSYLSYRFIDPYVFATNDWLNFSINSNYRSAMQFIVDTTAGKVLWPPAYQWFHTTNYISPLWNIMMWGVGLPVGLLSLAGIIVISVQKVVEALKNLKTLDKLNPGHYMMIAWILGLYLYYGGQFAKFMRYFLPVLPFFILCGAVILVKITQKRKSIGYIMMFGTVIFTALWTIFFLNIYRIDHTRVTASKWMYKNVPSGSKIGHEIWDDALPVGLLPEEFDGERPEYEVFGMDVFGEDTNDKLLRLHDSLTNADYIVLSSPRAWYTIGRLPDKYQYMHTYYDLLNTGELGYDIVYESQSPLGIGSIKINDLDAEEAFWVYDHPIVKIYKKENLVSQSEFIKLISGNNAK